MRKGVRGKVGELPTRVAVIGAGLMGHGIAQAFAYSLGSWFLVSHEYALILYSTVSFHQKELFHPVSDSDLSNWFTTFLSASSLRSLSR